MPNLRSPSALRAALRDLRQSSIYYRRHPVEALQYLYAKHVLADYATDHPEELIDGLGFDSGKALAGYARWQDVLQETTERGSTWQGWRTGIDMAAGILLYGLCRALEPRFVIETGVASGVSSAFIGAALVDNGHGRLLSLELPADEAAQMYERYGGQPYDYSVRPGWVVPDLISKALGERHQLLLEDVRTALPRVLPNEPNLDLFVHDDLHTVRHMTWEFKLVWPKLSPGGVIVADDAGYAWVRFLRGVANRADPINIGGTAALRKPV